MHAHPGDLQTRQRSGAPGEALALVGVVLAVLTHLAAVLGFMLSRVLGVRRAAPGSGRRWLASCVLCFALLPVQDLIDDVLTLAGVECCSESPCDDGASGCCPRSCSQCACCAHLQAVPSAVSRLLVVSRAALELPSNSCSDAIVLAGYRAALFRPPRA
jgi:hypothetical protein